MTWTVTGLPPGLSWASSDRAVTVTGTPTAVGTYPVTATATDSVGSSSAATASVVVSAPPSVAAGTLVDWTAGRPYASRDLTVVGGTAPLTWDGQRRTRL